MNQAISTTLFVWTVIHSCGAFSPLQLTSKINGVATRYAVFLLKRQYVQKLTNFLIVHR
jgi:hypothetical protein